MHGFESNVECCYNSTLGDENFCSTQNICQEDEGDCDLNTECSGNLFCGYNNCPDEVWFDLETDCCTSTQIVSPNYPNSYPDYIYETWLITAPVGIMIYLQFHAFHVCFYIHFENYDTSWNNFPLPRPMIYHLLTITWDFLMD